MEFKFSTATKIIFGEGTVGQLISLAPESGRRAFLICGGHPERCDPIVDLLKQANIYTVLFSVPHEPNVALIAEGLAQVKKHQCDFVIVCGGGSVIDAGKAISVFAQNEGEIYDYLEVIGKGQPITHPGLPLIAIPTTAGTGAEVTRNAVIGAPQNQVKVSVRSNFLFPKVAVIDPELTYSMPPNITAATGMDALTQLIEAFVSLKSNPLTDALCRDGINRVSHSLRKAFDDGNDQAARRDMCLASLFSGLALANAKLGTAHGIASVVGGMVNAPHGEVCARLLPLVMLANIKSLQSVNEASEGLIKYHEIAHRLLDRPTDDALEGVNWVKTHNSYFEVRPLSAYGLTKEDIPLIVENSMQASSTQGNPIKLSDAQLSSILEEALG